MHQRQGRAAHETLRDRFALRLATSSFRPLLSGVACRDTRTCLKRQNRRRPAFAAKTFRDFVALARSQPGKFNFGSAGIGTGSHLATSLLALKTGMNMVHVPFKGTGPALNALLGNEISVYMSTFASALPHVKQGRLRAYGVTTVYRAEPLPDVPTLQEEGVQDFEYAAWYGMFAPGGTPRQIVDKVYNATIGALKNPQVLQLYKAQGLNATPMAPAEFAKYIASEKTKWSAVVREANIPQQ
jgi:tripartite-type tricarboxylate transporter receptor subunit TctC